MRQASALIELFKSMCVPDKWPKNCLLGKVVAAGRIVVERTLADALVEHVLVPKCRLVSGIASALAAS